MPMRVTANPWTALLTTMVLSGCATSSAPAVRVDSIEGTLPNCQSFAWNPSPGTDAASFTDQRVQGIVMQTLEAKGYTQSADKPDCRIAYHLSTHENPQSKPRVGVGMGGGSGGVGGGVGISLPIGKKKAQSGTFTLDVIDANKNAQVWSGSIDASFDSAELSDADARAVVEQVLAKYPDRK
ncbi:MAG TPA: DUF4136 domain-containing protein [Povalibacter sp.]|uniref:DUF4136 domain-containing protein n=1 Tax=Povalibacter sp. TaxID=1962978 RepID=UPI002CF25FBE|nr:DUF4136 domain-containing protein [Povalibacter sp.]HMN45478.1 DUF4136 domain-containing protein [Povalibacter sp.]